MLRMFDGNEFQRYAELIWNDFFSVSVLKPRISKGFISPLTGRLATAKSKKANR